jgi:hypothetical protein
MSWTRRWDSQPTREGGSNQQRVIFSGAEDERSEEVEGKKSISNRRTVRSAMRSWSKTTSR